MKRRNLRLGDVFRHDDNFYLIVTENTTSFHHGCINLNQENVSRELSVNKRGINCELIDNVLESNYVLPSGERIVYTTN